MSVWERMGASTRTQSGVSVGTQTPVSGRARFDGSRGGHWSCEGEQDGMTVQPVRWWANWWREDMINPNAMRRSVG